MLVAPKELRLRSDGLPVLPPPPNAVVPSPLGSLESFGRNFDVLTGQREGPPSPPPSEVCVPLSCSSFLPF